MKSTRKHGFCALHWRIVFTKHCFGRIFNVLQCHFIIGRLETVGRLDDGRATNSRIIDFL